MTDSITVKNVTTTKEVIEEIDERLELTNLESSNLCNSPEERNNDQCNDQSNIVPNIGMSSPERKDNDGNNNDLLPNYFDLCESPEETKLMVEQSINNYNLCNNFKKRLSYGERNKQLLFDGSTII